MMNAESLSPTSGLAGPGFVHLPASRMRALLDASGSLADWPQFSASWNDLGLDTYMADGGRYRRRRHAVYRIGGQETHGTIGRQPHQPHYQGRDYNALNGGIDRWFEPVTDVAGSGESLTTILGFCRDCFGPLAPKVGSWHVEVHQFRIEARSGSEGRPTPEGMHRDGVDYVLVMLVDRINIVSGTTTVADLERRPLGSFTLIQPFDAVLVDDNRVYHGVTPIEPLDAAVPGHRDVLVVTFRNAG